MPDPVEAVALNADREGHPHRRATTRHETGWELAMSQDSLTGLLSWLEAAPPAYADSSSSGIRWQTELLELNSVRQLGYSLVAKAESKDAVGGEMPFMRADEIQRLGCPVRRSMPASSHSMEIGPS
jgi:hypothetical protein